jgi:hypothetical protein
MFTRVLCCLVLGLFLVSPGVAQDEDQSDYSQFLKDNPGVHKVELHDLGSMDYAGVGLAVEARKITTASEVRRYIAVSPSELNQTYTIVYFISEDEIDPIISFFDDLLSKVEAKEKYPQETHYLYRCRSGISLGARFKGSKAKLMFKKPSGLTDWLRTGHISQFKDKLVEGKAKLGI